MEVSLGWLMIEQRGSPIGTRHDAGPGEKLPSLAPRQRDYSITARGVRQGGRTAGGWIAKGRRTDGLTTRVKGYSVLMAKTKHTKGLAYIKAERDGTSKAMKRPKNLIPLPFVPFALIRAFAIQRTMQ
jgi:hypothetical protein